MFWQSIVVLVISWSMIYLKLFSTPVPDLHINQLDQDIQDWYHQGKLYEVLGKKMFAIEKGTGSETILLIHGFPTSSFDYKKSINILSKQYRVVAFDHLGFGFSDKPSENYTYSMVDQAEQALALWKLMGIKSANLVSHDMGDSVLTEILSRYVRGSLPDYFNGFFKKVVFTNGGMKYDLINFRLSQLLLRSPVGPYLARMNTISQLIPAVDYFSVKQLKTIWSSKYQDREEMDKDIKKIQMINRYKRGNEITHLTISYLKDRARFEGRWLNSLRELRIPVLLLWGNDDAVSPLTIPAAVKEYLQPDWVDYRTIDAGHFLMLEDPQTWSRILLDFINQPAQKC